MNEAGISFFADLRNRRLRVDEYQGDLSEVEKQIFGNVQEWVEKLIVKVKPKDFVYFLSKGYSCEGYIPHYFGEEDLFFMVKYFLEERSVSRNYLVQQKILRETLEGHKDERRMAGEKVTDISAVDAEEIARLFSRYFPIYPTPLQEAKHVRNTIQNGTIYKALRRQGDIICISSAEINQKFRNAELTDCLTIPEYRNQGLVMEVLITLEQELEDQGYTQLYTLARALSPGINRTFFKLGYTYGGCLINNCYIGTGLEDMNIWYKYKSAKNGILK